MCEPVIRQDQLALLLHYKPDAEELERMLNSWLATAYFQGRLDAIKAATEAVYANAGTDQYCLWRTLRSTDPYADHDGGSVSLWELGGAQGGCRQI